MYTVKAVLLKSIELPRGITMFLGSFLFTVLITIGAFVYIPLPFTPVPITLQVLFVLLAGIMLGEAYGTLSSLVYVVLGMSGLPVFAGAVGGVSRILGPTGGYIIGFLLAPLIVSFLFRRMGKKTSSLFIAMFAGLFVIYLFGMLHLSIFLRKGFFNAFELGVLPFIAGDTVKIILAMLFVRITRKRF